MASSAQRDEAGVDEAAEFRLVAPATELKQEVAARLAAHRRRRGAEPAVTSQEREPRRPQRPNAIAAAVAQRYARSPSYRAVLAEQAAHAAEEAAARAEVAQRNAEAAAAVQQKLLGELELWDAPREFSAVTAEVLEVAEPVSAGGLTVRLYENLGAPMLGGTRRGEGRSVPDADEQRALEAEIAFRKAPVFEGDEAAWEELEAVEASEPLPANLLEFPRQLVATRKARPRLAEGPLRDEAPRSSQLRIFEVEPEQISTAPMVAEGAAWSLSIRLDAQTPGAAAASEAAPLASDIPNPQTAPIALRTMAGLVDAALVLGALVAFVAVFAKVAGPVSTGIPPVVALGSLAVVFSALWLLYQAVFFWFSEQTPGMRYARIGLCTLSDENPTRAAMRRRILAQAAALCPLGLGLMWCFLDEDGLGWHDRLSRMYQRAY